MSESRGFICNYGLSFSKSPSWQIHKIRVSIQIWRGSYYTSTHPLAHEGLSFSVTQMDTGGLVWGSRFHGSSGLIMQAQMPLVLSDAIFLGKPWPVHHPNKESRYIEGRDVCRIRSWDKPEGTLWDYLSSLSWVMFFDVPSFQTPAFRSPICIFSKYCKCQVCVKRHS